MDNYESFKKDYLQLTGIDLSSYKENQMKRRINNFMTKHHADSYRDFLQLLKKDEAVYESFVAHLTINVSEFYRNPAQWEFLEKTVIPELIDKFGKRLKIWSAACSTGDEPYSLAMVLREFLPANQFEIVATDLDEEVLGKAKIGCYTEKSVSGLPQKYKDRYIESDGPGVVKVSESLKSSIRFQQHNLLRDAYPKDVHMIVCRNVLIYFTEEAKAGIYKKFAASLYQKGILFVGSTEQIIGATDYGFQGVQSFFYEKQ